MTTEGAPSLREWALAREAYYAFFATINFTHGNFGPIEDWLDVSWQVHESWLMVVRCLSAYEDGSTPPDVTADDTDRGSPVPRDERTRDDH